MHMSMEGLSNTPHRRDTPLIGTITAISSNSHVVLTGNEEVDEDPTDDVDAAPDPNPDQDPDDKEDLTYQLFCTDERVRKELLTVCEVADDGDLDRSATRLGLTLVFAYERAADTRHPLHKIRRECELRAEDMLEVPPRS
jgi:hypothetical protein